MKSAYAKWLGIPFEEQPPHHYRLLGIEPFESNPVAITQAADRRRQQLEKHLGGRNANVAKRVLQQIIASRDALLDVQQKAAYDLDLKAGGRAKGIQESVRKGREGSQGAAGAAFLPPRLSVPAEHDGAPASDGEPFPMINPRINTGDSASSISARPQHFSRSPTMVVIVASLVVGLFAVIGLAWYAIRSASDSTPRQVASQPDTSQPDTDGKTAEDYDGAERPPGVPVPETVPERISERPDPSAPVAPPQPANDENNPFTVTAPWEIDGPDQQGTESTASHVEPFDGDSTTATEAGAEDPAGRVTQAYQTRADEPSSDSGFPEPSSTAFPRTAAEPDEVAGTDLLDNPPDDLPGDPVELLKTFDIRIAGRELLANDEPMLGRALRDVRRFRRDLFDADRKWKSLKEQQHSLLWELNQLKAQHVQLNSQMARINPRDVLTNNRLVGQLNALAGQIDLREQMHRRLEEQTRAARAELVEARERYVAHVLEMRELADATQQLYQRSREHPAIAAAIERLNETLEDGETYALGPSRVFLRNLHQLEALEDTVISDAVPLRRTPSDSLYVSVTLNGEHRQEMVLDSGASIITLPHEIAVACGLEPDESAPTVTLQLADGRLISAKRITIGSVRVGRFTVTDVDAAVLGPEAPFAAPLLGMSFLGHFEFEVNADAGRLRLLKVETSEDSSSDRRSFP